MLRVCAEQVGLTLADFGTREIDANVLATDFYFGGPGDQILGLTLVPGGERFQMELDTTIPPRSLGELVVHDRGATSTSSPDLGALLITNSDFGPGARGGTIWETEALIFTLPGVAVP